MAHPIVLAIAVVAALVGLPYLARTFFGNRDQFGEDVGLAERDEQPKLVVDVLSSLWLFPGRGIWLNILWFLIALGLLVAVIYQVLARIVEAFA